MPAAERRGRLAKKNSGQSGGRNSGTGSMGQEETSSALAPDLTSQGVTTEEVQQMIQQALENGGGTGASPNPSGSTGAVTPQEVRQMIQTALTSGSNADGSSSETSSSSNRPVTRGQVQQLIQQSLGTGQSAGSRTSSRQTRGSSGGSTQTNQQAPSSGTSAATASSANRRVTRGQVQQLIQKSLGTGQQAAGNRASSRQTEGGKQKNQPSQSGPSSNSGGQSSNSSSGQSSLTALSKTTRLQRLRKLVKQTKGGTTRASGGSKTVAQSHSSSSTPESAAQVLTQAQFQLSQELEDNLSQLKKIIHQSQEIAKKIELVLGRDEKKEGGQS